MDTRTVAHAARYYVTRPRELSDRLRSELERRRQPSQERATVDEIASPSAAIHAILGIEGSCELCADLPEVWDDICGRFPSEHHHDAGYVTVEGVWAVTRHLRPTTAVETGVARGFSTATTLAAMRANGTGHLWSIDLPQVDLIRSGEALAAVPGEFRDRWTYLAGSSRRVLPALLAQLGTIDVFMHDSLHTSANMRLEMELAWPRLRPGGVLLVDDAADNLAFQEFSTRVHGASLLVGHPTGSGALGVIRKPTP